MKQRAGREIESAAKQAAVAELHSEAATNLAAAMAGEDPQARDQRRRTSSDLVDETLQ